MAKGPLRLERAGRAAIISSPASAGVPVAFTDQETTHDVHFIDMDSAILATRAWLTRPGIVRIADGFEAEEA
jgi:hypothetical protein